ncbi:MAG: ABC transporter ATP-binding protein [Chloroflexota bacterium]
MTPLTLITNTESTLRMTLTEHSHDDLLLEINNLKTHFELEEGTVRAVDGANLTLNRGRVLGIVGESGCGKSITSLSVMRLEPHPGKIIDGEILFHHQDEKNGSANKEVIDLAKLGSNSPEIRRIRGNRISMVFQEPMSALSPVITVGKQIMEAIRLHQKVSKAEAREIAADALHQVKMPNPKQTLDDYPFQLSGGMRQRAVVAMALSCRPNLLIADEPTTALDVTTEAQILDLMRDLQQDTGMAIMYITHNLGVIAEMAEEVAVMYLGKVVEQTDVHSVFTNPKHPYTQGLLNSIPRLDNLVKNKKSRLETIKGIVPDPYNLPKGCPFHPRCPDAIPNVCDQDEPPVIQLDQGQSVRCHLYV